MRCRNEDWEKDAASLQWHQGDVQLPVHGSSYSLGMKVNELPSGLVGTMTRVKGVLLSGRKPEACIGFPVARGHT